MCDGELQEAQRGLKGTQLKLSVDLDSGTQSSKFLMFLLSLSGLLIVKSCWVFCYKEWVKHYYQEYLSNFYASIDILKGLLWILEFCKEYI